MNSEYILTVHDELVSNLILLNCNNIVYNDNLPSKVATIKGKRVDISLVATSDDKYKKFIKKKLSDNKNLEITEYDDEVLKNNYSLSSREIIVYLVLLHHYIVSQQDNAVITVRQINKYYRQIRSMNDYLYDSYIRAIQRLNQKQVFYHIKKKYVGNRKLTNFKDTHKLLNIINATILKDDFRFEYNLGSLGKIIRDSKNYSTIVPNGIYSCKYSNINYLLIFLYLSRMIYINRNQRKSQQSVKRISLRTICENICKYDRNGYNMNITYADLFSNNIAIVKELEFNRQFYERTAEDYGLTNSGKEDYYLKLISRDKKKINKCINKNRDLRMIIKNLKSALTILKSTHQIVDFNLIMPARIREFEAESCNWNEINGKNWDMFMIELIFFPYDTQSMKLEMQRIKNYGESIVNKRKSLTNIERKENEDG